jgi:OOP family OmpA-OmpF porin
MALVTFRPTTAAAAAVIAALAAVPIVSTAQTRSDSSQRGRGYLGLNLGRSDYKTSCVGGFSCDNPYLAGKVYVGGLYSRVFGMELGYINTGNADRNGGGTKAQGVNVSLVGNLPLTDTFNFFAKGGTTYAWTEVTAAPGSGVVTGDAKGFGPSYGAGVGFDVTRNVQLVAEWDHNRFKFVSGRENVDLFSLGAKFKF